MLPSNLFKNFNRIVGYYDNESFYKEEPKFDIDKYINDKDVRSSQNIPFIRGNYERDLYKKK